VTTRGFAAALYCLALALAGCGGDEDLAEATYTAVCGDAHARVWMPINEPLSVGTYRGEITWSDGTIDRIESGRDGMISDVWLAELGPDGSVCLIVTTHSAGSGSHGSVHVHRRRGDAVETLDLSMLDPERHDGYMGHDSFNIEEGRLYRSYPRYHEGDTNASPSGGTVELVYSFSEGEWFEAGEP